MLHRKSGLVLASAGALLLISTVALGQTTTGLPPTTFLPTHGPVSCSELAEYSNIYRNCDTYSNCSGTLCHLMQPLTGSRATFWVEEKCADPVMVDLNVDGPENSYLNGYRGRFRVGGDGIHTSDPNFPISADYGRDASHLTFQAMTFIDGDQALRLIPEITIPLNPDQCMCQSMRQIARIIRFPNQIPLVNLGLNCSPRPDCTGVHCDITFGTLSNYVTDVTINPCGETMRIVVLDSQNDTQFDRVFNDSGSYTFNIPGAPVQTQATLNIGMVHHNYSMDLSVSLQTPLVPENILPLQKIILDRSHCTNLTYYYEDSASTTTSVPPVTTGGNHPLTTNSLPATTNAPPITTGGIPPATTASPPTFNCLQMSQVNCQVTGNCSGVSCRAQLSGSASSVVASAGVQDRCVDPVMVNLTVGSSYQKSFGVPGDSLGSVESINGDSVRVEYGRNASHLHFEATGLIPEVHIPLRPHFCMCQSMDNLSSSIQAGNLFSAATSCSKRPNCDGVRCNGVTTGRYTSDIIIDPCQESVRIVLRNTSNGVVFNRSFTQSAEEPLNLPVGPPGLSPSPKLYVGIVHYNFSMQLSMKVNIDGVGPIVLLAPQRIILDRTNCVDITYYHTKYPEVTTQRPASPSPSGGHGGGSQPPPTNDKHSAPLSLVVGVPFGILLVLAAGLLIAIVTVLILWRIRKRKRAYAFQRMTFSEVDDDDEKD